MSAFLEILRFEARYQLRNPVFPITAVLFFLLSFGAIATDSVVIGGSIGSIHRNAPFVITQILLVMSVIGVFATTAFVASAVQRDYETGASSLFFSLPVSRKAFLFGRFFGSFPVAAATFVGVVGGIMLGSVMPWLEPERVGAFRLAPYLAAVVLFVLPNLFVMACLFFCVATLTRSLFATYGAVAAFFVGYLVSATMLRDVENELLPSLLDPFGVAAFAIQTKYWTVAERNLLLPGFEGRVLANRLLWLAFGVAVLLFTAWRFRFAEPGTSRRARRRARAGAADAGIGAEAEGTSSRTPGAAPGLPFVRPQVGPGTTWRQFLSRTRLEMAAVLRGPVFLVLLLLGVFNVVGGSFSVDEMFGTPVYPVTHLLLQIIDGSFGLFALLILTAYAGELVFRERSLRLAGLTDALPVSESVFWGAKLAALAGIVFVLMAVAMATGIGVQLARGFPHLEPGLYLEGLFLKTASQYLLFAVLALFFQVVTNQKFVGFLLVVVFFISFPILESLHFEHHLYQFATTPDAPYSDMNGFGHFAAPLFWFTLYWAFLAGLMVFVTHLLWVRGSETGLGFRLRIARQRASRAVLAGAGLTGAGFLATGAFIFYNTNILNAYVPNHATTLREAAYEKAYKRFESSPNPRITAVRSDVAIYPRERRVEIRGRYALVNPTGEPLQDVRVTWNPRAAHVEIAIPGATLGERDDALGWRVYRLADPLAPGAGSEMTFEVTFEERGFVNNGSNTRLAWNGTFFDSFDTFPHLGYSKAFELTDPNERRRNGLPPIERLPKIDDEPARRDNALTRESDWLDFETTVSTSADQVALAPGYLQREWTENGRRFFQYKMDAPILGFWAYLSGRWEVQRDRWNDVAIEVYHHPAHAWNVPRMIDAVKKSLTCFTEEFGPYQHRQVRIVEFPRYARFAQSFPNTIPFSESIGFIARLEDEDAVDTVFYVTAHEVAHQWWAHQVIGANVQGASMLAETLSQYSALLVMEREYGPTKMRRFLKYELDGYLRGRGGERIEELPLMLVEDQPYVHYNKGSVVTWALRDLIGEKPLDQALSRFVTAMKYQKPPYTTTLELLSFLQPAIPVGDAPAVEDLLRKITLFENRAVEATSTRRADGKFDVRLKVSSRKLYADGSGAEAPAPLRDRIDVAVFGDREPGGPPEGKVLLLEKRLVDAEDSEFTFVVDEEPRKAGIDPFNILVDRNPENNLTKVTASVTGS